MDFQNTGLFPCKSDMLLVLSCTSASVSSQVPPDRVDENTKRVSLHTIKNACIGSRKRKLKFLELGIVPTLVQLVAPDSSFLTKDALIILQSLWRDEAVRNIMMRETLQTILDKVYEVTREGGENAEIAAKFLLEMVTYQPFSMKQIKFPEIESKVNKWVSSPEQDTSKLGLRLFTNVCLQRVEEKFSQSKTNRREEHSSGNLLTRTLYESILTKIAASSERLEGKQDDLEYLALSFISLAWLRHNHRLDVRRQEDGNSTALVVDLWTLAINNVELGNCPVFHDIISGIVLGDAEKIARWTLNRRVPVNDSFDPDIASVEHTQMIESAIHDLRYSLSLIKHQNLAFLRNHILCGFLLLVHNYAVSEKQMGLIVDVLASDAVISYYSLSVLIVLCNKSMVLRRACVARFAQSEVIVYRMKLYLTQPERYESECILRLLRILSECEECTPQLVRLEFHHEIMQSYFKTVRSYDACAYMCNLMAFDRECTYMLKYQDGVMRIADWALSTNGAGTAPFAFLSNLCATTNLDLKKQITLWLPLERLICAKGLNVLCNLCSGGYQHVCLVESLIPSIILFITSKAESLDESDMMELLANIATGNEDQKAAWCGHKAMLSIVLSSLRFSSPQRARLAGIRFVLNMMWNVSYPVSPSAMPENNDNTGPIRNPMLRMVQARMTRPLRFGYNMLRSSSSSSNGGNASMATSPSNAVDDVSSTRVKFIEAGFRDALERLVSDPNEEDLVKEHAQVALHLLSMN